MTQISKPLSYSSTVTLSNGVEMPVLGLGTFQSPRGDATRNAVLWALEAGYRHIDTAALYDNEEDVGKAIQASGIPREEIFITTKLWNSDQKYDDALKAYQRSLDKLGIDMADLHLVHWPIRETRLEAWNALVHLYREHKVRAVGVSNYSVRHIVEAMAEETPTPMVNQFELNPFNTRPDLVSFCQKEGIQVESWGPLVRGTKWDDPVLNAAADVHGKTVAQVLIRWGLQRGFVVIPKSIHRERIIENANVFDFELTPDEMAHINALNEGLHTIRPAFMQGEWE